MTRRAQQVVYLSHFVVECGITTTTEAGNENLALF